MVEVCRSRVDYGDAGLASGTGQHCTARNGDDWRGSGMCESVSCESQYLLSGRSGKLMGMLWDWISRACPFGPPRRSRTLFSHMASASIISYDGGLGYSSAVRQLSLEPISTTPSIDHLVRRRLGKQLSHSTTIPQTDHHNV